MNTSDIETGSEGQGEKPQRLSNVTESGKENLPQPGLESDPHDFGPAPDGGLEAWLVAVGASSIFFCTLGFTNSFGVFQEYYMTHQLRDYSANSIAWIGSLCTFLQFGVGLIGGPLFDRYGSWVGHPPPYLYSVEC